MCQEGIRCIFEPNGRAIQRFAPVRNVMRVGTALLSGTPCCSWPTLPNPDLQDLQLFRVDHSTKRFLAGLKLPAILLWRKSSFLWRILLARAHSSLSCYFKQSWSEKCGQPLRSAPDAHPTLRSDTGGYYRRSALLMAGKTCRKCGGPTNRPSRTFSWLGSQRLD